jgi:uncharacterized membrane protein
MRLLLIDSLKGFAFILMVIQHIFYFYDVSKNYKTFYNENFYVKICGSIARNLFILLVGYSLSLSYKNNNIFYKNRINRSLVIIFCGFLLTILTNYLYPEYYIRFGILHFIGLATLLLLLIVPYKKFYLLFLIISVFLFYYKNNLFTENKVVDTILGTRVYYNMMDYFPLLDWLPVVILGMFIESIQTDKIKNLLNINEKFISNTLASIGKNSLNLYVGHVFVLILFYYYVNNNKSL